MAHPLENGNTEAYRKYSIPCYTFASCIGHLLKIEDYGVKEGNFIGQRWLKAICQSALLAKELIALTRLCLGSEGSKFFRHPFQRVSHVNIKV